jgi:hypothetical protein
VRSWQRSAAGSSASTCPWCERKPARGRGGSSPGVSGPPCLHPQLRPRPAQDGSGPGAGEERAATTDGAVERFLSEDETMKGTGQLVEAAHIKRANAERALNSARDDLVLVRRGPTRALHASLSDAAEPPLRSPPPPPGPGPRRWTARSARSPRSCRWWRRTARRSGRGSKPSTRCCPGRCALPAGLAPTQAASSPPSRRPLLVQVAGGGGRQAAAGA